MPSTQIDDGRTATQSWFNAGLRILYHEGTENYCPGCGQRHWVIGRLMAECAYCTTAIPLQSASSYGGSPRIVTSAGDPDEPTEWGIAYH